MSETTSHLKENQHPAKDEPSSLDLSSLLQYKNPERARYDQLIARLELDNHGKNWKSGAPKQTPYADIWVDFEHEKFEATSRVSLERERYEQLVSTFREKMEGETLIDLGGDNMAFFAEHFGAHTYIGVNRYANLDIPSGANQIIKKDKYGSIERVIVQDDMLDFVSRMRSGTANFVMNGIDHAIIADDDYHHAVAQEIIRATKPGGLIFGYCALPILQFMNSEEARPIYHGGDIAIRSKP